MPCLKLTLAYDGTDFRGWQSLGGRGRSVQECLRSALCRVLGEEIEVDGAGRTDAGAHAAGQVASLNCKSQRSAKSLLPDLNSLLPRDLACLSIEEADERFHARYRARSKRYRYRFLNSPIHDPFLARYSLQVPQDLDIGAMEAAVAAFIGRHDFRAFTNLKGNGRSFERELFSAALETRGSLIDLHFVGDGFLYNQVRIMASAVLEAGLGHGDAARISSTLVSGDRAQAPGALGAFGLCLMEVGY